MTDKELKAIYEYMVNAKIDHKLDSNSAWECVQEMEKKGHELEFTIFAGRIWSETPYIMGLYFWLMNPINFFNCFAKWLMSKEKGD
jgi:hypothetical protein